MVEIYDQDYFERGIATGKSLYENYRWIPELTIPLAMTYIDLLGLEREHEILDFGCAKGYVVKALRMLYRNAWGCDISHYAIEAADCDTKPFLKQSYYDKAVPFIRRFHWIIAKDVLEHIQRENLQPLLVELREFCQGMLVIVPLGECGKFNVPAYNLDTTHKIAESIYWWTDQFRDGGWEVKMAEYQCPGIKDSWASYDNGNGFFVMEKKNE